MLTTLEEQRKILKWEEPGGIPFVSDMTTSFLPLPLIIFRR